MKFLSQAAVLLLATGVYSRAVEQRDLATVTGVLTQVQTGIDTLDAAVKAFNGDPAPVKDKSDALVATINTGTTTVQGSTPLTVQDTIALFNPVNELKAHAQTLSDDLLARRADVAAAKQCDVTRNQIGQINTASQGLITAIVDKVPPEGKAIAQQQAQGIIDVLTEAQANFASDKCQNAA
ncbi:hydrophobic surface binding protein A domain-containing protein [Purpureocillium lilacinum]|uniref:Hydrophobic surface binding protein A domain-containing protein n=2 Tax=Purpureocillium lilacinum TaxID=33203 RepID=A0A179FW37_PURLI|nr:hydrophobic surface binding protein A domain-containing protein [Purpureocillium lilacinum]KAK4071798.1 hypothetical protein Purlil1_13317 [Purpureocillium lilacinum]OAQ69293.1 hydrophobic surface binding protein A domain-containing protein [Purpureocillium lilacinum]OAQ76718.1 hydrophobic surface binding protein A domain-containing protein [Purpureocillium lilacinum]PWI69462.1 hypothetical protein PCL_01109 [Purpureocillium lilacinum]GJN72517.1 hypothetical protein PLICBS_006590 [Purpureoc